MELIIYVIFGWSELEKIMKMQKKKHMSHISAIEGSLLFDTVIFRYKSVNIYICFNPLIEH